MPSFAIPPDNRAIGTGNPPADANQLSDVEGLLAAVLAQSYGYTGHSAVPGDNATNIASLAAVLGTTADLNGATGWINATQPPYNCDPTGSADPTAGINAALLAAYNARPGTPVYLPAGLYTTSAPVVMQPASVLIGDYANQVSTYLDYTLGTVIQPRASWASAAAWSGIVTLPGQSAGGFSRIAEEQKIIGISLDCHNVPGALIDGIQTYGDASRFHLERIMIGHAPRHAFSTVADGSGNLAGAYRLYKTVARYAGTYGFLIFKNSDISAFDCMAENCVSDGYNITNISNGMLVGCRAEHNGSAGVGNGFNYICTNSATGSGTAKFLGCSTDRNEAYGIAVGTTNGSGVPVQIVGCQVRRDGRNNNTGGGGFAGIFVTGYPSTVMISGTGVFPGVDDGGAGTNSPQYGLKIASNSGTKGVVLVGSSHLQGNTAGVNDDNSSFGVYYGPDVIAASGPTSAPVVAGPRQGNATLTAGSVTVACTSVTSTSKIFLTSSSTSANQGRLYISALSAGVSFTVSSSNGADATAFVWQIMNP